MHRFCACNVRKLLLLRLRPLLQRTLELSDAQVSDLLQLRRIWLAKVAQLSLQRDQLLQQMTNSADMSQHPGHVMTSMSRLATALKENAAENYRVYNRTVCALLRGVSNSTHCASKKSVCRQAS